MLLPAPQQFLRPEPGLVLLAWRQVSTLLPALPILLALLLLPNLALLPS
jgi:hypothetical protein